MGVFLNLHHEFLQHWVIRLDVGFLLNFMFERHEKTSKVISNLKDLSKYKKHPIMFRFSRKSLYLKENPMG